jgi:hypothetical protein
VQPTLRTPSLASRGSSCLTAVQLPWNVRGSVRSIGYSAACCAPKPGAEALAALAGRAWVPASALTVTVM